MSYLSNDTCIEKRVARDILSIIERIYFCDEFQEYRIKYGTNGQRDLIIQTIKDKYEVG